MDHLQKCDACGIRVQAISSVGGSSISGAVAAIQMAPPSRLMPCFHIFCRQCFEKHNANPQVATCSICHLSWPSEEFENLMLPINRNKIRCNNPEHLTPPLAVAWCRNCDGERLCLDCRKAHKTVTLTRDHELHSVPFFCDHHEDRPAVYLCHCGKTICELCLYSQHVEGSVEHDGTKRIKLETLANRNRQECMQMAATMRQSRMTMGYRLEENARHLLEFETNCDRLKQEIANDVVKMVNILIQRGSQMTTFIDKLQNAKKKEMNEQKYELVDKQARYIRVETMCKEIAEDDRHASMPIVNYRLHQQLKLCMGNINSKTFNSLPNTPVLPRVQYMNDRNAELEKLLREWNNINCIPPPSPVTSPSNTSNGPRRRQEQQVPGPSSAAISQCTPAQQQLRSALNLPIEQSRYIATDLRQPRMPYPPPGQMIPGSMQSVLQQMPNRPPTPANYGVQSPVYMQQQSLHQQRQPFMPSPNVSTALQQQRFQFPPGSPVYQTRFPVPGLGQMQQNQRATMMQLPTTPEMVPYRYAVSSQLNQQPSMVQSPSGNQMFHAVNHQSNETIQRALASSAPFMVASPPSMMMNTPNYPVNDPTSSCRQVQPSSVMAAAQLPTNQTIQQATGVAAAHSAQLQKSPQSNQRPKKTIADVLSHLEHQQQQQQQQQSNTVNSSDDAGTSSSRQTTPQSQPEQMNTPPPLAPKLVLRKSDEKRYEVAAASSLSTAANAQGSSSALTDEQQVSSTVLNEPTAVQERDDTSWDDYCYVCQQGCDDKSGRLGCCASCPRVFHANCHIPIISGRVEDLPDEWCCSLCEEGRSITTAISGQKMGPNERLMCAKVILSCYRVHENASGFRNPVSHLLLDYKKIIATPMYLTKVARRLIESRCKSDRFETPEDFIGAMNLIFKNCSTYNRPDTPIVRACRGMYEDYTKAVNQFMPALKKSVWLYETLFSEARRNSPQPFRPLSNGRRSAQLNDSDLYETGFPVDPKRQRLDSDSDRADQDNGSAE